MACPKHAYLFGWEKQQKQWQNLSRRNCLLVFLKEPATIVLVTLLLKSVSLGLEQKGLENIAKNREKSLKSAFVVDIILRKTYREIRRGFNSMVSERRTTMT